jgi:hypothetical protein
LLKLGEVVQVERIHDPFVYVDLKYAFILLFLDLGVELHLQSDVGRCVI